MKEKKVPMRTCLGCGSEKPKKELIRIVHTPEGKILPDITGKMNGRGTYVCPDMECITKICKGKKLSKAFGVQIDQETYDKVCKEAELIISSNGGGIDGRKQ